jgi:Protein of unknown function (DUF2568)
MAIRFVCEILALIIFGFWGFQYGKIVGVIGMPLIVAVIWAIFGSPAAPYKLKGSYKFFLELFIFGVASYLLYQLGYTYLALIFCIVALGTAILIRYMKI